MISDLEVYIFRYYIIVFSLNICCLRFMNKINACLYVYWCVYCRFNYKVGDQSDPINFKNMVTVSCVYFIFLLRVDGSFFFGGNEVMLRFN